MRIVEAIATVMAGLALGAVSLAHAATQAPVVPSTGLLSHASSAAADLAPAQSQSPVYGVAIRSSGALPSLETLPAGPSLADAFGHDFTADLDGLLWSDNFQTYTPFAGMMQTGFGTVMASGYAVRTNAPYLFAGPPGLSDYHRYSLRDFQMAMAVMPGVTLRAGYRAEMAGRLNGYDAFGSPAYDGLFFSAAAVNSPYLSLVNGGDYLQASIRIADGLDLHFGTASLNPQQAASAVPVSTLDQVRDPQRFTTLRQAQATEAGVSWKFAPWGGLGVTASDITERNGLLGDTGSDALSTVRSANTTAIGLTARFGFGAGWVTTIAYNEGLTKLNLQPNAIGANGDMLRSRAYGIAVAKRGLFGKSDSLGLALTRPVQVYNGGVNLTPMPRTDLNRALGLGADHLSLATGATPETDVELGYTTTFFDGALALQANAGYQMNYAGQSGNNAVTVLSRAKINF